MRMTGEEQDRAAALIQGHHPPQRHLTELITRIYHYDISFSGKAPSRTWQDGAGKSDV
jgi:hypothetical protein